MIVLDGTTTMTRPYADAAFAYQRAGWISPIPLGRRGEGYQKSPVPTGYTGWAAQVPSGADIQAWSETHGDLNIGLRMPLGVYVLDVDEHKTPGAWQRAQGFDLPETWTSTARGPFARSRHHFYRYDPADMEGRVWLDHPADGLDSLHAGHRYSMVWPSVHPSTGETVHWYDTEGELYEDVPAVEWLAVLSRDQVHALSKPGEPLAGSAAGDAVTTAVIESFRPAPACGRVEKLLSAELDRLARAAETAIREPGKLYTLVSYGIEGHAGVHSALIAHRDAYVAARVGHRPESETMASGDWWRQIRGAVGKKLEATGGAITETCGCGTGKIEILDLGEDELLGNTPAPAKEKTKAKKEWAPNPAEFTEAALAGRIAEDVCAGRFVWNKGLDWMTYSEGHWVEASDVPVKEAVRRYVLDQVASAATRGSDFLIKNWMGVTSASKISNMVSLARGIVEVPAASFDAQVEHLNTPGGYLELSTGQVRPHEPGEYPTKVTGAEFNPDARSDLWDAFLERILPDPEVREFLARIVGYSMLGVVREHKLPILTGVGRNGKGTFRDALVHAMGGYALEVDPELVMVQGSGNARHGTFMLELMGRRVVFTSETEKKRRFAESTVKRLTGGDPIQGNRMKKDPITFQPSHTLFLCTNHLPKVSGDDPAIWARLLVIPFDVVIPPEEQDGTLPERLKSPEVSAAVLAWAHRGHLDYLKRGLAIPAQVSGATARYHDESDHLGRFLRERVGPAKRGSLTHKALNEAYVQWCRREDEEPLPMSELGTAMLDRGFEGGKTHGVRVWRKIEILPEILEDFGNGVLIEQ